MLVIKSPNKEMFLFEDFTTSSRKKSLVIPREKKRRINKCEAIRPVYMTSCYKKALGLVEHNLPNLPKLLKCQKIFGKI